LGYDIARELVGAPSARRNPRHGDVAVRHTAAVFALQGDLGAGKTTFTQGFLKGLGSKKHVTSPTFVLMRRHALGGDGSARRGRKKFKNIFHIDAYRIKKPEHLAALALDEIFNEARNVVLIEWPEQARRILPKDAAWIKFKHGKKENERTITIARAALP
jgi:tRNA threonylcarbamoyl adenosine modification protein YjeE